MAFDKTPVLTVGSRTEYDLDNDADRELIKIFERDIEPFLSKKVELFGRRLSKIEVYFKEKGLMRYSEKYPRGAVVGNKLVEFNEASMKWQALQKLWDRREYAQKQTQMEYSPA